MTGYKCLLDRVMMSPCHFICVCVSVLPNYVWPCSSNVCSVTLPFLKKVFDITCHNPLSYGDMLWIRPRFLRSEIIVQIIYRYFMLPAFMLWSTLYLCDTSKNFVITWHICSPDIDRVLQTTHLSVCTAQLHRNDHLQFVFALSLWQSFFKILILLDTNVHHIQATCYKHVLGFQGQGQKSLPNY